MQGQPNNVSVCLSQLHLSTLLLQVCLTPLLRALIKVHCDKICYHLESFNREFPECIFVSQVVAQFFCLCVQSPPGEDELRLPLHFNNHAGSRLSRALSWRLHILRFPTDSSHHIRSHLVVLIVPELSFPPKHPLATNRLNPRRLATMSDSDGIIYPSDQNPSTVLNAPRRLPHDFPVRTGTLNADRPLGAHVAELTADIEGMTGEVAQAPQANQPNDHLDPLVLSIGRRITQFLRNPDATRAEFDELQETYEAYLRTIGLHGATSPTFPQILDVIKKKIFKKCATTLVSKLRKSPYKEPMDSTERSLAYVTVQCAMLKYLNKAPSDTLTSRKARSWTQAIEPNDKMPLAKDALRLCYYMRSQGFDTYASLEGSTVCLFVVDPDGGYDSMYWRQNFQTNEITYLAPSELRNNSGRRNAMVAGHSSEPHFVDLDALFGAIRGSGSYTRIPESIDSHEFDSEDHGENDGEDYPDDDGVGYPEDYDEDMLPGSHEAAQAPAAELQPQPLLEQERTQLEVRMAEAQAALDTILSAETANPGYVAKSPPFVCPSLTCSSAIEAAIALVEGYQQVLDRA